MAIHAEKWCRQKIWHFKIQDVWLNSSMAVVDSKMTNKMVRIKVKITSMHSLYGNNVESFVYEIG